MTSINNTKKFNLSRFIKNLAQSTLFLLFLTQVVGCSSLNDEAVVEKAIISESSLKGPYEIAAEENIPSVISYEEPEDSLRFINEPIFKFNDKVYRYVLSPFAVGYQKVVPLPVDQSIRNFFYNLREPLYALNHLFQGELSKSGNSLARVLVNSTIGLFGLFDPANSMMELERDKTTFGETLASYGVGHGVYLVLPLLGPSVLRDTASLSFNYLAHPLNFINDKRAAQQLLLVDGIQAQTPILAKYPQVLTDVENPYEFTRNLYMQSIQRDGQARRNEVFKTEKQKQQ
ncbi:MULTISPECIES: VacJ family lipoprotein [unclassified Colwellia]|uniref:MlaA family lipoprotein n=1 Tax=unclassified Colwellia TaxID=196834 RepID=UPI0015F699A8|nr:MULTISPECIES: VacJ family lipoprotein [unclassified Colwellia]MBA6381028.1 VacJ family lipoprotein [Colwellia sp. BRX10-7]MBA6388650.1 VacJ family lipoprotein [Colwellia sp. BRX10-2]MBA6403505.1 VacJ family lipoprotein [Colwellia sp. BRX10-5]MBA6407477.1 VacJ family lipoprotein [Colwellia sp. BRX10-1]